MSVGTLQLHGTIDVTQFWPSGDSDADTTKVLVDISQGGFEFRAADALPYQKTTFYEGARVRGRITKSPIDAHNRVTIRLQGIDAPELHYEPSPLSAQEKKSSAQKIARFKSLVHFYCEPLGPTTTSALHDLLARPGASVIQCRVFTHVDQPDEVFDTYARMVGDIEVTVGGQTVNINQWLAQHGQAFPTFYSSMSADEINTLEALAKVARSARRGLWKFASKTVGPFDFGLRQPKKGDVSVLKTDRGPVLMPKLFRRQCSWATRKKSGINSGGFQPYLVASQDHCFQTKDFLAAGVHSATPRLLSDFVKQGKKVLFDSDDLVFNEAAATLIDAHGKVVTHF